MAIGRRLGAPSPFTMEQFGVSTPEDMAWNEFGLVMQPLKTLVEPVTLDPGHQFNSVGHSHGRQARSRISA